MNDQAHGRIDAAILDDTHWSAMTDAQHDALRALASSTPAFRANRPYGTAGAAAAAGFALVALGLFIAVVIGIYEGSAMALDLMPGLVAFASDNPIATGFAVGVIVLLALIPIASGICDRRVARAEFEEITGDR